MSPTLRDWLAEEPFTLTMSSGFFGFFAHTGVLEALVEAGLRPRRVTGSSAGALVGGLYAAGLEPDRIAEELLAIERAHFWDPAPGLGLLRGRLFRNELERLVGGARLEDSRVPTSLVIHDVLAHRPVARSTGELAPIIHASCAVPLLFQPVWIDRRPFLDGGILDRSGTTPLAPDERTLYHHLASKSPWRAVGSIGMRIPERAGLSTLVLDDLPRAGPFRIEVGPRAYAAARAATKEALGRPHQPILHVRA